NASSRSTSKPSSAVAVPTCSPSTRLWPAGGTPQSCTSLRLRDRSLPESSCSSTQGASTAATPATSRGHIQSPASSRLSRKNSTPSSERLSSPRSKPASQVSNGATCTAQRRTLSLTVSSRSDFYRVRPNRCSSAERSHSFSLTGSATWSASAY